MIPANANQKNTQKNEKEKLPDKFEDMPAPWSIHLAENFPLVVILAGSLMQSLKTEVPGADCVV